MQLYGKNHNEKWVLFEFPDNIDPAEGGRGIRPFEYIGEMNDEMEIEVKTFSKRRYYRFFN